MTTRRQDQIKIVWLGLLVMTLGLLAMRGDQVDWLFSYPKLWVAPVTTWMNVGMQGFIDQFGFIFRHSSKLLDVPLGWVQVTLHWLPWPAVMALTAAASYRASGWKLVIFSTVSLFYMLVSGYWIESMNSLSLVIISVPLALVVGFFFGALGYLMPGARKFILPMLDILQTIPAFAYLLPILLLFGFGPVVGLIASLLYSFPPMVRNTMLGLERVEQDVAESGLMSGATPGQLFWQVRVPSALRQILLGVNQTIMASFSMIIIASIIGGTADIGWEVTQYLRKAAFGECLLTGFIIALMAMVMDRISRGLAERDNELLAEPDFYHRHQPWIIGLGIALAAIIAAMFIPAFRSWPENLVYFPAKPLNDWLADFILVNQQWIKAIKGFAFFYIMLPIKVGFQQTISPYSWGFELTPIMTWSYAAINAALGIYLLYKRHLGLALCVGFIAIMMFFGLTQLPWLTVIGVLVLAAWQMAGIKFAIPVALFLLFMLVTGIWPEGVISLYLCGIGVIIAFVIGSIIGIIASQNDRFSKLVRPIHDTLQTMPMFVFLIPFVMVFKIGDFTALLAIIAYAFVPAARYCEHGLRNVDGNVIEAARAMGCTHLQLLWRVKLPLAVPEIMLGLNQTIMYAIAMLVITALVGTSDLGQMVYIGLGDGDFGIGFLAGIGMAIIAMIADRMIQHWSRNRQQAFGL